MKWQCVILPGLVYETLQCFKKSVQWCSVLLPLVWTTPFSVLELDIPDNCGVKLTSVQVNQTKCNGNSKFSCHTQDYSQYFDILKQRERIKQLNYSTFICNNVLVVSCWETLPVAGHSRAALNVGSDTSLNVPQTCSLEPPLRSRQLPQI